MQSTLSHQTLADIVTADTRIAAVFDRAGLDYCCHGHQALEDAAAERGVPLDDVLAEIIALGPPSAEARALNETTELDAITSHIVSHHHRYVRESTPIIEQWLAKLVSRHGPRHPELRDVQTTFKDVADEMRVHMVKEENLLFPYIDALAAAARESRTAAPSPFGTILNPIRVMEEDHRHAGDQLDRLRQLTNAYTAPADGCRTFTLCYEELGKFAADLHRHVHLENNVLFPRAVELEQQLA
jgi:regulator of cell morphogenesis and NO signaling